MTNEQHTAENGLHDPPPLPRSYSPLELRAARRISMKVWSQPFADQRGPLYYAAGPGWPGELRRRAAEAETQANAMRLVADAMEREGCVTPPEVDGA